MFPNEIFWCQGIFFMNFDCKNGLKNEFKDNNETSYSWSRHRVSHKIDFKAVWPGNGHADSVAVKAVYYSSRAFLRSIFSSLIYNLPQGLSSKHLIQFWRIWIFRNIVFCFCRRRVFCIDIFHLKFCFWIKNEKLSNLYEKHRGCAVSGWLSSNALL